MNPGPDPDPDADLNNDLHKLYVYSSSPPFEAPTVDASTKLEHETHCDHCINVRKCQKMNILGRNGLSNGGISCRIIQCKFICGQEFHACKQGEHDELCPNVKVPCLNVENGCPLIMERRYRSKHLSTCPASVVVCTMEWNRWSQPPGSVNHLVKIKDGTQLDVVLLQRDEQTVREGRENVVQEESDKANIQLNIVVEVLPRSKFKLKNMNTFMCDRVFRRDEYPSHFRNVHSEIITQLNGWLFCRCPLVNQGCDFGVERIFPHGKDHRVIYNQSLDAFCATKINSVKGETEHPRKYSDSDDDRPLSICDLPFEVLVHLTAYLDPLSLRALSMTSTHLRSVCALVLVERGIVVLQWGKNVQSQRWEILSKKWRFSTSFSSVPKWSFGDVGRLSNHMMKCSHFERQIAEKPFCYPVELKDL